jgi:hypothetical protein
MTFFQKIIIYSRDVVALVVLLVFYHGYEVLCYITGNMFPYYVAVGISGSALFLVSMWLIALHDFFQEHFSWDALKLQYLNNLAKNRDIPSYQIFRRLTGFVLHKGFWAILVLGPIILGPFITTVLLRKQKTWRIDAAYAGSGALFSALFWVAFMRGLGLITWGYLSNL